MAYLIFGPRCMCLLAVVKKSFASGDQTLNIYDRRVLCSVREMFFAFVFVFYIW